MKLKHKLLTILMMVLASTLLIFTACEDEADDPITEEPTNSAPTCTITSPDDGAEFTQGETITIAVAAEDEDENLKEVRFYVNDVGIGSANSFPYNFDWDTSEEEPGSFTIKAEAIDEAQEKTSNIIEITLKQSIVWGDAVTDIDGNTYNTVIIGNQEWMAENLKTTTYKDGTSIDLVTENTAWENNTIGAYCWYDNDEAQYADTYGALYNWYAVETGNLCPDGWHVPTDEEWTALEDYIASDGHSGTVGTALKATSGWNSDGNGTDDYGFTALPGGDRYHHGALYDVGSYGNWWSATDSSTSNAWSRYLHYNYSSVYRYSLGKERGFSVRCLRD